MAEKEADGKSNDDDAGAREEPTNNGQTGNNNNNKSSYRQKYKHSWELDTELRDWLTACSTDPFAAYCRFCRTKLHAHKKGLLAHAKSTKHKNHLNPNSDGSMALMPSDSMNIDGNGDSDMHRDSFDDDKGTKRNHRGQRLFNDNWLKDPLFTPWLRKVSTNNTKAFCAACRCIIMAGRCELIKHSRAAKHKKAIMEGKPLEEIGDIELHWLEVSSIQDTGAGNQNMSMATSGQTNFGPSLVDLPGLSVDEVVEKLDKHVPLELAEKWDNVGVITKPSQPCKVNNILLTNDLNEKIVEEAIKKRVQFIISYHPPVFNSIKSLNPKNWMDKAILMCIEHRITVYSPHTALDAVKGGINDWLISTFMTSEDQQNIKVRPIKHSVSEPNNNCCFEVLIPESQDAVAQVFNVNNISLTGYNNSSTDVRVISDDANLPEAIEQLAQSDYAQLCGRVVRIVPPPIPGVGMGRIVTFATSLPLYEVVHRTKTHLDLNQIRLALSPKHTRDTKVNSIAVCAGSGSSILKGTKSDVWITGEMSHHEVLDAIHKGVTVLLCEHSNTERGFLRSWCQQLRSSVFEDQVMVSFSELDREPLRIV